MDLESDIAFVLVEFLAKFSAPVSLSKILDEIPFDKRAVSGVVYAMNSTGFLAKEVSGSGGGSEQEASYSIVKNITAYHIIKLGELGLDMMSLSGLVKISDKQKQAAMSLALQTEKLAEMDDAIRLQRVEAIAKNNVSSPLPRDAVVDTLERLAMASEMSIKEMGGANGNEEVRRALLDAKAQALKALLHYQSQLGAPGAEHSGF